MYGIHLTRDKVLWSCLGDENQYEYSQDWGDQTFKLMTTGEKVNCFINGKKVFSYTKGIRVISDFSGKITAVIGIETKEQGAEIEYNNEIYKLDVSPDGVYLFNGRFSRNKGAEFYK